MEIKTSANVETIQQLYQALSQGDAQGIAALAPRMCDGKSHLASLAVRRS